MRSVRFEKPLPVEELSMNIVYHSYFTIVHFL